MKAEDLRPGDVVTSTGDVIVRGPVDHGTYLAYVVRSSNGAVTLRYWDRGYDVTLHRTYDIERGPRRVTWAHVVRYFGSNDAADAAFRADHITEHFTRDELS